MAQSLSKQKVCISDVNLLQFFYPSFRIESDIDKIPYRSDVIFTGKLTETNVKRINAQCHDYILVTPYAELKLQTKEQWADFYYRYRLDKDVPKTVKDVCKKITDNDMIDEIKSSWILRKPLRFESDGNPLSIYSLYQSLTQSHREVLRTYFRLLESSSIKAIESGIITFLSKALSNDYGSVNPNYAVILNQVKTKLGGNLPQYLNKYFRNPSKQIGFLELLLDIVRV